MHNEYRLKSRSGDYLLRPLSEKDGHALAEYFAQMSPETRSYYGPHPLNAEFAQSLCQPQALAKDTDLRLVVANGDALQKIYGYFIVQTDLNKNEQQRYAEYSMPLQKGRAVSYAPSMAESMIGKGVGSQVFDIIRQEMLLRNMTQIVLMGGVQKRNALAVHYYQKLGFVHVGSYHSDVENLDMILQLK